jgi:hypothetical protein
MAEHSTRPRPLVPILFSLLAAHRSACRQDRVFARLVLLTVGLVATLGRHTLTQVLVTLGAGTADWSAWYRLFNRPRLQRARLERLLLGQVLRQVPRHVVLPVVLDATQLPRSSARFPGVGWTRAPRTPAWRRGIHLAQRWELLSWLVPRSAAGDSRAIPLRTALLRSARSRPCGTVPERTEWAAGRDLLTWLRTELDRVGRRRQRVLAIADGTYSTAKLWAALPHQVTLLARCAKHRALFALPPRSQTGPGRRRKYGDRGPTPQTWLTTCRHWQQTTVMVRGRAIPLTYSVTGPWLVKPAAGQPLFLLVVKGIERGRGAHRRQRDPAYWLVSARQAPHGTWVLPLPAAELLAWAWQRWEVEVMHRELKSGFGLGEQQTFSAAGAQTVVAWVVWTYAILVLAGYRAWGLGPGPLPALGGWWSGRRWSLGTLWQALRQELWQCGEFQPVWARSPDEWAAMTTWLGTQLNATQGYHRL